MQDWQTWLAELLPRLKQWLVGYGPQVAAAVAVFVLGWFLVRVLTAASGGLMRRSRLEETVASFLKDLLHVVLITLVIIAALNQLGVQTASLVAVLGAAALAVGLALRSHLSSLAAGVLLLMVRPFRVGDFVEVGGQAGGVAGIRMLSTTLSAPDGLTLTIPNHRVFDGVIVNYTAKGVRRVDLVIGVGYEADLLKTREVLLSILRADSRVLAEPAARVDVLELADSSVNFAVRPWAAAGAYWDLRCDLLREIKLRLDAEGISIPFPQRDIRVVKG